MEGQCDEGLQRFSSAELRSAAQLELEELKELGSERLVGLMDDSRRGTVHSPLMWSIGPFIRLFIGPLVHWSIPSLHSPPNS